MYDSTSDCQLNQSEVDFETESNKVPETFGCRSVIIGGISGKFGTFCGVDDQFVPKVGITFNILEDAAKFYKDYSKVAGFSTRVRSTNKKENKIKNQLITCSREEKWKSKISPTEKTNSSAGLNYPAKIYIRILKDVDFHTVIPCATKSSIEAQFQHVYTHQKFREVQAQFRGKVNCIIRLMNSALGYSVYKVGEQVSSSIFNKFAVSYDSVAVQVKCQCLLFESKGILCRHALSVLSFERVTQESPRYILERWSKKVKRRHTHIKSSHDEPPLEPRSKRFEELGFRSQNICEFTSESKELIAILHRAYDNVMVKMEELKAKRKGTCSLSHEDANLESVNELQSPPRIANVSKKKKTKALSELNLFDVASVVQANSSQYHGHFKDAAAADSF
ncbi:hypothetical protein Ahy_B03g066901 [Arachis hypogaea]|uniref:Protein FAR1-RELATED SEQUENCE n=1 Tax=Arachis hypogaea TaxID=3818 RepID=A0A445A559_ARAHY|nr:hypothetical protein Ahy_B03g066901 [Arachis hypogaea]